MARKINFSCDFNVVSTESNIHFTPDACHNIKLARNALGTFGAFKDADDNLIEWKFINKLHEIQNKIDLKLEN